jgi:hypothetical protein
LTNRLNPVVAAASTLLRRPDLWPTLARTAGRLVPPGWWRRWPPLPLPDRRYLAFRMETAYGRGDAQPRAEDLVAYLEWCRRQRVG